MRPLLRWTMGGNVSEAGWDCLSESVRITPKVYPEFDYVICCNNLNGGQRDRIKAFGIDLYEQKPENIGVPFAFDDYSATKVANHAWKLCPLRLRSEAHEIWIDNDIILWERIPEIDEFLSNDVPMVSQTWHRELYGQFDSIVPQGCSICAGFFGLPPQYPFREKIDDLISGRKPLAGYDEQGMIAAMICTNENGWIGIDPQHLNQLGWWEYYTTFPPCGHFIRLNTGTNSGWETYKMMTHPSPKIVNSSSWEYNIAHVTQRGTTKQRAYFSP